MPLMPIFLIAATSLANAPSDQDFDYFVGKWNCQGHFEPSKRPITSTMEFARRAEAGGLEKRHADLPPGHYLAMESWSYVPTLSYFRATISDRSSGMRWYTSQGWSGGSLTWARAGDAEEKKDQFVYRRIDADAMQVDWLIDRGGGMSLGDTLLCRRAP